MSKVLDFVQKVEELSQFLVKRSGPARGVTPESGRLCRPLEEASQGGRDMKMGQARLNTESYFRTKNDRRLTPPSAPDVQTVAFHDPCHAKRKLKIFEEPRRLLSLVPGLTLVELEEHRCCGHGGLFNLSHPDLSQNILDHPLGDLDRSQAEVITTSCMACLMQFKSGVQSSGRKVQVKHWSELMVIAGTDETARGD
jgi:Fe-S oxidoreductase